jgi:hypothetical protein
VGTPFRHIPVRENKRLGAGWCNSVSQEVAFLSAVIRGAKGANGLDVSVNGGGLLLALLANQKDRFVLAKITFAPPFGVPILPSLCLYKARGIDRKIEMLGPGGNGVRPEYGLQVVNDEVHVYPEKVGNFCFIARNPQADGTKKAQLWVFNEVSCKGLC